MVAALSADAPPAAQKLRLELGLPFPLLCDPERAVITAWGLLNTKEHGGIAYPAVFVLDADLRIRYRSLDDTLTRIHPGSLLGFLRAGDGAAEAKAPRRVAVLARPMDWWRGIRNYRALRNRA